MRKSIISRKTNETDITLKLNLDGKGINNIDTGCGFLDHMLTLFSNHSKFDLDVKCVGDVNVDYHHTVEDTAIALGQAFKEALGEKRGIVRYGQCILPMDETLILSAVDISGRSTLRYNIEISSQRVGGFDTELCEEFFNAFVRKADITLHLRRLDGTNSHHIIEGTFKAFARCLRMACATDKNFADEIPSSKGTL